jgi:hypothetical protein
MVATRGDIKSVFNRDGGDFDDLEAYRHGALPPSIILAAIAQLLDRGMAKPMQPNTIQHLGEDGLPTKPTYVLNVTGCDEPDPAPAPKANGRAANAGH